MVQRIIFSSALAASVFSMVSFMHFSSTQNNLTGAWRSVQGSTEQVLIFQDGYFSHTVFDKTNKQFIGTVGGIYKESGNTITAKIEFNSKDREDVGKEKKFSITITGTTLDIGMNGDKLQMKKIDDGKENLAGIWRITGRMQNGQVSQLHRGERKTLKILSGTRFQWMAINPGTKEFFGTGGGTYTFNNGKYAENIEFFSRDNSRVGTSLTFDGSVKDNVWNHTGLSSKGDPINEFWTKEKY